MTHTARPPCRIDTHAHVIRRDLPFYGGRRHTPDHDALPETFLSHLDSAGVTHGLLTAPSFFGPDNSYLLETLAKYPDRLRGTAIVEPSITRQALDELDRGGIVGIRLNLFRFDTWPDLKSAEYQRLLRAVAELDWHVEVYAEGDKIERLLPVLLDAGVKVVLDHFASPHPTLGIAAPGYRAVLKAVAAGRTWVKLSAPYRLEGADPATCTRALMEHGGPDRLMWGSDWPWTQHDAGKTYAGVLGWLTEWVPDEDARRRILWDTPSTLFRFA